MSYQSDNLDLEILEEGDPADLTTVSDNFDKIDAVAGDIATIETSPTQSSHAAGEFLLYEGRLYKVTSAISAGGSLILGTNVSAANIGNELQSLKDNLMQGDNGFAKLISETIYLGRITSKSGLMTSSGDILSYLRPSTNCVVSIGEYRTDGYGRGIYIAHSYNNLYGALLILHYTGFVFIGTLNNGTYTTKEI